MWVAEWDYAWTVRMHVFNWNLIRSKLVLVFLSIGSHGDDDDDDDDYDDDDDDDDDEDDDDDYYGVYEEDDDEDDEYDDNNVMKRSRREKDGHISMQGGALNASQCTQTPHQKHHLPEKYLPSPLITAPESSPIRKQGRIDGHKAACTAKTFAQLLLIG